MFFFRHRTFILFSFIFLTQKLWILCRTYLLSWLTNWMLRTIFKILQNFNKNFNFAVFLLIMKVNVIPLLKIKILSALVRVNCDLSAAELCWDRLYQNSLVFDIMFLKGLKLESEILLWFIEGVFKDKLILPSSVKTVLCIFRSVLFTIDVRDFNIKLVFRVFVDLI